MAKTVHNDVLDAALDYIAANATRMCVCSAAPSTYAEAITTYMLADVDITSGDFTGPADGDTSGRKLTVDAQAAVDIDTSGTGTHIALVKVATTTLLYVTTCTDQVLIAGETADFLAWDVEILDPS